MRDLVLRMTISLDGFVSDAEGRNDWMFGDDPEAKAWVVATVSNASLHVMGSRTFRAMADWWPRARDAFAAPMNTVPKTVFSRSLPRDPAQPADGSWEAPWIASGTLADEIARLKAGEGAPIVAHGGVAFARSLVAARLVDRIALLVAPVALGRGQALFSDLSAPLRLRLVSSTAFPGGAAALVYAPAAVG